MRTSFDKQLQRTPLAGNGCDTVTALPTVLPKVDFSKVIKEDKRKGGNQHKFDPGLNNSNYKRLDALIQRNLTHDDEHDFWISGGNVSDLIYGEWQVRVGAKQCTNILRRLGYQYGKKRKFMF